MRRDVLDELPNRARAVCLMVWIVPNVPDIPATQPGAAVSFELQPWILALDVADADDAIFSIRFGSGYGSRLRPLPGRRGGGRPGR